MNSIAYIRNDDVQLKVGLTYLNSFSAHNQELLGSLHEKTSEFVAKDFFDIIRLLNTNRYTNRVYRRLNQTRFLFWTRHNHWIQRQFFTLSERWKQNRKTFIYSWYCRNGSRFSVSQAYFTSTSGLLCLSTTWEGKLRTHTAAFNVALTVSK